jgi:hypothetical protein
MTDVVTRAADRPVAPPKTYRRHNCKRRHRSYRTLANCMWPRAVWVNGDGPYATLARCRVLTVALHASLDAAHAAKRAIDQWGCGGRCPCTGAGHELVRLASPAEATSW